MRRSYLAIAMGIMMGASLLNGCASTTSSITNTESSSSNDSSTVSNDSNTIYGEVSKISDSEITIEVGTMKEMSSEKPENSEANTSSDNNNQEASSQSADSSEATNNDPSNNTDSSADDEKKESPDKNNGEVPSMIDKSGEEKTITVSSDTKITKQSMGNPGQGGAPSGGTPEGGEQSGEAPEKPEGEEQAEEAPENSEGGEQAGEAPENSENGEQAESDEKSSDKAPEKPENNNSSDGQNNEEISLSDISEGDIISITFDDDENVEQIIVIMSANNGPGGGGQSQAPDSYETVTEYTEDTSEDNKDISSDGIDENAVHAYNGAKVSLSNFNITRNSSDSEGGDSSSFYGIGATVLESNGTLYLKDSTIESDAKGGAGIFAYGDGIVYTADTKITTTQSTSGGIHAAGAGTLYAWDMDVETSGESSAAIRSDRGGGTMIVNGGTYTSNGIGSPAIYSTADIAVNNATLTANGSEAVCIEGLNSLHLYDSDLTGNMSDDEQNDCTWNIILYQSMSGDSEVGNSTFEMNGGTLTAKNGGMFYTTNTESTFILSDVDITYADDNDFFLRCTGNNNQRGWGTSGNNGADCHFTAAKQEMQGDIIWDSISMLDFYMTKNSSLIGAVTNDETYAKEGGDGYCNLYIEEGSIWTVTGDSTLTNLENAGTILDESGKTVTIKGTDGTIYVEGDSEYTVTVESYKDSADVSGASATTEWSDYEVERPSEL